ncbi:MAG: hypothetical protein KDC44_11860, partial [Phaeodactylibacter sp.]|nr:hypothetical protein [Phaeodactylibacter sp.]
MRDNYLPRVVFWTIFCIPSFLFAQLFTDQSPIDPVVCNATTWSFSIENDQSEPLASGTISIQFPTCINYVPGSVSGLTEQDISNLNAPVFAVPALASGAQVTVSLGQEMDCGCLALIDAGVLFSNQVSYTTAGNTFAFISNPYEVNTPLLVLTSISNSFFSGSRGTIFQRILKVKNTRPGPLESFEFIDIHQGGLSMDLDAGQPLPSGSNELRVLIDGTDFQLIGDGDALFEQDEEITLIETVTIEDCGVQLSASLSAITLGWGCNDVFCQVVEQSALVQILQNELEPELKFIGQATAPVCFCGPDGHPQSLTVINTGNDAALDVQITLLEDNDGVGLFQPSVQVDSAGQSILPAITPGDTVQVEALCETPGVLLNSAILSIAELQPGDTLVISWNSYFCQPDCNDPPHSWSYTYSYLKACPPDPFISEAGSAVVAAVVLPQIELTGPGQLLDDSIYTFTYQLTYNSLTQVSGSLELNFVLPCGLSWVSGPPMLGGVSPITFDQSQVGDAQHFTAVYELPFLSSTPELSFDLQFDCAAPCLEGGGCEEQLFSSCTEFECSEEGDPVLPIEVSTSINACAPFPAECGIETCVYATPSYFCEPDSICLDTVPGYIAFELSAQRLTWGLPDSNNDRFADPGDPYDTDQMRLDRLIAGDTFQTVLSGLVIGELPEVAFPFGLLSLEFIPSGLDVSNNPELTTPDGIQPVSSQLQIWDAGTGQQYTCSAMLLEQFTGGFGLIYDHSVNIADLLAADCGLPADFQFEAGDSIRWTAQFAVLHNPVKASPQQAFPPLIDLTIRPFAALALEEVEERADYQSCGCSTVKMELSGFEFELFPGIFAIEPCDTSDYRGATFFEFRLAQGNFFPYEFRNLLVLQDLRVTFPEVVDLVETRIDRLLLQNGPELYNDAVIVGQAIGDSWTYDLESYQMEGLDEGFVFLLQYRFLPDCTLQGVYLTEVEADLQWADGLPAAATPPGAVAISNAIRALLPTLQLENAITYQTSLDNQLQWYFLLNNLVTTIATQNSGPAI